MDKRSRHSNNSLEKYLKYFKNFLSGRERHALEKDMMRDAFEEEAFEGLSQLETGEFSSDMAELQKRIEKRTRSRKIVAIPLLRYAAAAVLILGIGTIVILVRQTSKNATELAEQKINEDTMLQQKTTLHPEDDSLKKNIAYKPDTKKESRAERIQEIPAEKEAHAVQQPAVSPAMDIQTTSPDEILYDTDFESDEMPEAEQSIQYEAEETYTDEMAKSETTVRESTRAKRVSQGKKSRPASSQHLPAERSTVAGRVLSATDETPLPGVNILIKGTTTGTVSDIDGNFRIEVPVSDSSVLQFAYLGYTTEEMEVSDIDDMTVTLNEELMALDEVVVVGYGSMKRTSVTGSVVSVQAEEESAVAPLIIPPKPGIGLPAYKQYMRENTRYEKLPEFNKPITVKLSFRVSEDGKISTIVIEKSEDHSFDEEAIRLVREGPSWLPGTEDGQVVTREVTLKVKFQPRD